MMEALRRRRARLDAWLAQRGLAHTFALPVYQLHRRTLPLIEGWGSGPCLDAGAGRSPWRPTLEARGIAVFSLDVEARGEGVDLIADLQHMPQVADASMATVLCTQVLEHLPRPWDAVAELARVLRPGGHLILSVPHLSMLHEVPHDYFRFTRYGLESLLSARGLRVMRIEESGGLVSLLCHALSMLWMTTLGCVPGLRWPAWLVNYLVLVRAGGWLDACIGLPRLYPCNYVLLARREGGGAA
jgi:SAM-dependent methyltransferase